jgi:CheY-like chemotaxis protein
MFSWYENLEESEKIWLTALAMLLAGIVAGYFKIWILMVLLLAGGARLIHLLNLRITKLKIRINQALIAERIANEKLGQQIARSERQQEQLELAAREIESLRWDVGTSRKESPLLQAPVRAVFPQVDKTGTVSGEMAAIFHSQPHPLGYQIWRNLPNPLQDDRDRLRAGDRCVLILADDLKFAGLIREMVQTRSFGVLMANDGKTGILLAERYQPRAILLDMVLSRFNGWEFMLNLRSNPATGQIPVYFLTPSKSSSQDIAMGAPGMLSSPLTLDQVKATLTSVELVLAKPIKKLLAIGKAPLEKVEEYFEQKEISLDRVETGAEALYLLSKNHFDCVLAELGLPDISGFDLMEHIQMIDDSRRIPVILYSGSVPAELELEKVGNLIKKSQSLPPENLNLLAKKIQLFLLLLDDDLPHEDDLPHVKKRGARLATP